MRLLLIGTGRGGRNHLKTIKKCLSLPLNDTSASVPDNYGRVELICGAIKEFFEK